jgi:hypothetical protein
MVGNGGLGEGEALRRTGKAAMDGDGVESSELGVSHIGKTYMIHKNIRFD